MNKVDEEKPVTVCDRCLKASCWQGEFCCMEYKNAGTVDLPIRELRLMTATS